MSGWMKRPPGKEGAYWRRRLCECGMDFCKPEVVHLVKSKRVAGTLAVGHILGVVVDDDPAVQWIHKAVEVPGA